MGAHTETTYSHAMGAAASASGAAAAASLPSSRIFFAGASLGASALASAVG